jgi:hypothetical protein
MKTKTYYDWNTGYPSENDYAAHSDACIVIVCDQQETYWAAFDEIEDDDKIREAFADGYEGEMERFRVLATLQPGEKLAE